MSESSEQARELSQFGNFYQEYLLKRCLPFWTTHAFDLEYGGYITALDRDGSILDADKSVWQQGRFSWLLSTLYNQVEQNPKWLAWAGSGIDFLEQHCFDPSDGRMWFHVTREGKPIRKRRYSYSESFAAIAFAQFALASGEEKYASRAKETFESFAQAAWTASENPKFEPTRPAISIGYPMCTLYTAQQLKEAIRYGQADKWITKAIDQIATHFVKDDIRCVMECVSPSGEIIDHFEGRQLNPGHAIEAAWFIMHEGHLRQNDEFKSLGLRMLDYMLPRGWDDEFGGLLYFVDVDGKPVQEYWHDMKFWWPHNEAIIAVLYAYLISGDENYLKWHRKIHDWAFRHFADQQYGEWYGYLRRDGQPTSHMKGNLWKGPFHLPRMLHVSSQLIQQIQSRSEG